jgi:hypothetical protein
MTSASAPQKIINLYRYSLFRIPKGAALPTAEATQGKAAVAGYITGLLNWLRSEESKRSFEFPPHRLPEVKSQLIAMVKAEADNTTFEDAAQAIANRLHEKQNAVQGGAIDVQEGVLLCADMEFDGTRLFLLAKLEFVGFLNEKTWEQNQGVPVEKNRALKACCFVLEEENGEWIFDDISVYDSNSTIAKFWWSDFLELSEQTNDQANSKRAYDAWMTLLTKRLKQKYPADFLFLKSGIQFQFQTRPEYDHEAVVSSTLDHYQPANPSLDVAKLAAAARALPAEHERPGERFDTRFTLDSRACRIKITRLPLTEEIQLVIRGGLEDLKSDLRPLVSNNQKGIFVVSEEGFKQLSPS